MALSFGSVIFYLYICTIINQLKQYTMAKTRKLDRDERQEIGITITNKLIELGYVPDCTDTDDQSEFEVQDMIAKVIKDLKLRKKVKNNDAITW
jgi:hypothetical protein